MQHTAGRVAINETSKVLFSASRGQISNHATSYEFVGDWPVPVALTSPAWALLSRAKYNSAFSLFHAFASGASDRFATRLNRFTSNVGSSGPGPDKR